MEEAKREEQKQEKKEPKPKLVEMQLPKIGHFMNLY